MFTSDQKHFSSEQLSEESSNEKRAKFQKKPFLILIFGTGSFKCQLTCWHASTSYMIFMFQVFNLKMKQTDSWKLEPNRLQLAPLFT